ncbi:hypothetical protein IQ254_24275 [Nodosilinea sp. LEGE 07088]|uniref:hypothetical protein n=1 Tax=Nodosilinea sp. LEGE 07088 TaxID=2777968 RepID=UPI001882A36C|nr:hypothetical protein [Nodosilinea sp. LEGE 07088]MBE9140278.1 hypothetical protein [Nodosilinea sp. LEGE 07088]
MIDVSFTQTQLMVGSPLSGTVNWQWTNDPRPEKLRISMYWYTTGRGTLNREVAQSLVVNAEQFSHRDHTSIPFSLLIPHQGPVSYDGFLFRLIWELGIYTHTAGFWARNNEHTWPFTVIPRQP